MMHESRRSVDKRTCTAFVPTPPEPPRRDPRDAANDDIQGRYVERGAWRPIDYEV